MFLSQLRGEVHISPRMASVFTEPRILQKNSLEFLARCTSEFKWRNHRQSPRFDKKRKAIEKGVQLALADMLPQGERKYKILHHTSRSHYGLQIADYCCWAVYRKWDRNEMKYYDTIKEVIHSEFDIFRRGNTYYY